MTFARRLRRRLSAPLLLLSASACTVPLAMPAQALDDQALARKLASIPVLMPTDAAGKPVLIDRPLDGKSTPVLFGAFSPEAAEALQQQIIQPQLKTKAGSIQFRATNLVDFEAVLVGLRQQQTSVVRAYVPDPLQDSAVVPMLIEQGAKPEEARQIARSQPVVFCPDPLVQVNVKRDKQSTSTVPCGLDFREMALFLLGPRLKDRRPGLVALPLDRMVALMRTLKGSEGDNLTITSSPSMQALLNRLSSSNATPASPSTKTP
jgi:hypothetical protein